MLNKKALAGTPSTPPAFVEDVFSTYLYTGNATARSIVNDIDLLGEGGLVWTKSRSLSGSDHYLVDTVRGNTRFLNSNSVAAQTNTSDITAFNNNGYSLNNDVNGGFNNNGATFCSWTFREQAKFFDVVTYTGDGATTQSISHSLGSTPRFIIVKSTSNTANWKVLAWDGTNYQILYLNLTNAGSSAGTLTSYVSSTAIDFGGISTNIESGFNTNGQTYVAYLFAHNAGGFGTAGTDNVISCGTFTTATSTLDVTLGYEPQYLMIKRTDDVGDWQVYDNMRGMTSGGGRRLYPNLSNAEDAGAGIQLLATGFNINTTYNATFIYMAIRRPMKVPTTGTSVFSPNVSSASVGTKITTGFPVDLQILGKRAGDSDNMTVIDRLRKFSSSTTESNGNFLETTNTGAENTAASASRSRYWDNTGFQMPSAYEGEAFIFWNFSRRPGFFDEVCYSGNDVAGRTLAHNLTVVPELMIVKRRSAAAAWRVYTAATGNGDELILNATDAIGATTNWNLTTPTSSVFSVGGGANVNEAPSTYVAYLFATCAGVSKVGSYTGNGSSQTINCDFTAGARFVLIKRTDSTGDWCVFDTARGIVSGNDPFLELNTTAAEQTGEDAVDPANSGFIVNETTEALNTNAATYIFLAIS